MHISHNFIATKTCPSYEFLVVFGQVRVWDRKSGGRARVGMVCGAGAAKIFQTPAGADTKFQPAQDSTADIGFCNEFTVWYFAAKFTAVKFLKPFNVEPLFRIERSQLCWFGHVSRTGVTNLFAIAGLFVSYRWVSGPHNFLVILWNC